jgi:tetratricopeptide (TPR) repeat protein
VNSSRFVRRFIFPHRVRRLLPGRIRRSGSRLLRATSGSPVAPATESVAAAEAATASRDWGAAVTNWQLVVNELGPQAPARAYVQLSRARRQLGQLELAAAVASSGQAMYPKSVKLAYEQAEIAMRAKDWPRASALWATSLDLAQDRAPSRVWVQLSRAGRFSGSWDQAATAVVEGRARFPDDVDLLIEDAWVSVNRYRSVGEAEAHAWKSRITYLAPSLEKILEEGGKRRRVLSALGEVQLTLRQWNEAIVTLQALRDEFPDYGQTATLKLAAAHRQSGDFTAARLALANLSGAVKDSARYGREVRRLNKQFTRWAAAEAASLATMRFELGDLDEMYNLVLGALSIRGYSESAVELSIPLIQQLRAWDEATELTGRDVSRGTGIESPHKSAIGVNRGNEPFSQVISVSGFLYSGSGAILDYFRQHAGVSLPFGVSETGFLKKSGNLALLLESEALDLGSMGPLVVEVILSSVFGLGQSGRALAEFFLEERGDLQQGDIGMSHLMALSVDLVRSIAAEAALAARAGRGSVDGRRIEMHLRTYLNSVIAKRSGDAPVSVLNNAIIGHELDRIRLLSEAKGIAVFRDPRDQYVSQRLESPYALSSVEFIEMMKARYLQFAAIQEDVTLSARIRAVCFEDFVSSEAYRERLLSWAGLEGPAREIEQTLFFPDVSQRNVGIHRAYQSQPEVARVQKELGEYYHAVWA